MTSISKVSRTHYPHREPNYVRLHAVEIDFKAIQSREPFCKLSGVLDISHQIIAMVFNRVECACRKNPSLPKSTAELLFEAASPLNQLSRPSKRRSDGGP
jgi:hypothetical protein